MSSGSLERTTRRALAAAISRKRVELSQALFDALRDERAATWKQALRYEDVQEWGRAQILTAVDILREWLRTGDSQFQDMFCGWVHARATADLTDEQTPADYKASQAIEIVLPAWSKLLAPEVGKPALDILSEELARAAALLAQPTLKTLDILFIGDCIQFEIITALIGPCTRAGIAIRPVLISDKVQPILRNRLRAMPSDQFKLVFFSPFSHRYLPEYAALLEARSNFSSTVAVSGQLHQLLTEVSATLDTLTSCFECPVYVHNTAGTVQSFGLGSGLLKNIVSWRRRAQVRQVVNEHIARQVENVQPGSESRRQLLDEDALRRQASAFALGRVYFSSLGYHPTHLGVSLGKGTYFEATYVHAFLASKKVIVCDLDNTLWEGVIGEGEVRHWVDRHRVLKELRRRGVLLSINSKNDPKNIRWAGALLEESDFVASQINWEPKAANMSRIRDELNLKTKDFVFIDDRPDERERMQNAFPEILVLDATDALTWRLLSHWAKILNATPEEDRTKQYHERGQREHFIKGQAQTRNGPEDETAALEKLELSVDIREARASELKRVAELINRTNQFNLSGTRTSLRELQQGLNSPSQALLIAEASDKFGKMGVVGVMCVQSRPEGIDIPIFVLSCRVFGFGIEYVLLHAVKQIAPGDRIVSGQYKETQFNEPCRRLYPQSGMKWDGSRWVGKTADLPPDPLWLRVRTDIDRILS